MKNVLYISFLSVLLLGGSCKKKTGCFEEFTFRVTGADAPSLAQAGDTIPITIQYKLYTDCQQLNSVSHTFSDANVEFTLKGQEDGCDCESHITEKSTSYSLSFPNAGTYYLKFVQETGFYLIDTLIVS